MRPFGSAGGFELEVCGGHLRQVAVKAAGITVFAQGMVFAVQMLGTAFLARLLTPHDFGVVTIVTTFSLLLGNFGLNGFTETVLQAEEITDALASNLFWINIALGVILSAAFAAAGSLIAGFYAEPAVRKVAVGMAFTIFFGSFSVLHLALLKRGMCYSAVSTHDVISRVVSIVVSIFLGWRGYGYWALVAGAVSQTFYVSASAWWICRWIPRLPGRVGGTGKAVYFAGHTYAHFVVNYVTKNLDNLLVGWRFGALALGYYKKAYDLFVLPTSQLLSPLSGVAISTLSRLKKDPTEFNRWFQRGLSVLALVGMAVSADLTLIGRDVIRLLLGPQWDATGRIFEFFGPGIGLMLIYNVHSWMHLSLGRAERWFRWGLIEVSVTALLFLLALNRGPAGIAAAWTISYAILTVPALWYAGLPADFQVGPVVAAVGRYAIASLLAGCACAGILSRLPLLAAAPGAGGAVARILANSLVLIPLYSGAVILIHGSLEPFREIGRLLPTLAPGARPWGGFRPVYAGTGLEAEAVEISAGESEG